jgi:hypothetical protein
MFQLTILFVILKQCDSKTSWIIEYPFLAWKPYFYPHYYSYTIQLKPISDFKIEIFLENLNANWNYQEIANSKYFDETWFHILDLSLIIKKLRKESSKKKI